MRCSPTRTHPLQADTIAPYCVIILFVQRTHRRRLLDSGRTRTLRMYSFVALFQLFQALLIPCSFRNFRFILLLGVLISRSNEDSHPITPEQQTRMLSHVLSWASERDAGVQTVLLLRSTRNSTRCQRQYQAQTTALPVLNCNREKGYWWW